MDTRAVSYLNRAHPIYIIKDLPFVLILVIVDQILNGFDDLFFTNTTDVFIDS